MHCVSWTLSVRVLLLFGECLANAAEHEPGLLHTEKYLAHPSQSLCHALVTGTIKGAVNVKPLQAVICTPCTLSFILQ